MKIPTFGPMRIHLVHILIGFSLLTITACKPEVNGTTSIPTPPSLASKDLSNQEVEADEDKRMSWQKPSEVINAMGDISDKVIVDLGAGIGYFSFKLLPRCERVIAVDIDADKIEILNGFKNSLGNKLAGSLETRLAQTDDPNLRSKEADMILIVNTIGYLTPRVDYLSKLKQYLKAEGKVFIVDFKTKRLPGFANAPSFEDRVYMHVLEDQLEAAGYSDIIIDDTTLDFQYMVQASL